MDGAPLALNTVARHLNLLKAFAKIRFSVAPGPSRSPRQVRRSQMLKPLKTMATNARVAELEEELGVDLSRKGDDVAFGGLQLEARENIHEGHNVSQVGKLGDRLEH
eukprot:3501542-Pyramimonas_sp.AAC.1